MSPSELRIGNYVLDPYNKEIILSSVEKDASMLRPIPLTEQWLIDFGMEMPTNEDQIFEHGNGEYEDIFNPFKKTSQSLIDATFEYDGKEFWADSEGFWFSIMHTYTKINYVHEFQNLIFALTGKELTLQK